MAWVRIDDGFTEHPKIARVGAVGAWLQIQALCYANRNLTDGFIPQDVAEAFTARGSLYVDDGGRRWLLGQTCGMTGRDVTEVDWPAIMVEAGIWHEVGGGYQIHDYDQYQPTKAEVLAERSRNAEKQERFRKRRNPGSNRVTHAVTNPGSNRPPVPVPGSSMKDLSSPETPAAGTAEGKREDFVQKVGTVGRSAETNGRPVETAFPVNLALDAPMAAEAGAAGCDDPPRAFALFAAHARMHGRRAADWRAAWSAWCLGHDGARCCRHAKPAMRLVGSAPLGSVVRDVEATRRYLARLTAPPEESRTDAPVRLGELFREIRTDAARARWAAVLEAAPVETVEAEVAANGVPPTPEVSPRRLEEAPRELATLPVRLPRAG